MICPASHSVRIYSPCFVDETRTMNAMQKSEKDRLAEEVVDRWVSFQMALYNKRKYPAGEFNAFATSVRRHVARIGRDPLIHREIASARPRYSGFGDFCGRSDLC